MPLKTPTSPPKSSGKPAGKPRSTSSPPRGKSNPAASKKTPPPAPPQPAVHSVSWWESLTDERKLDIVGVVMALLGLAATLILFSAQRSEVTGTVILYFSRAI